MARRITWAPLGKYLPDWRTFWFEGVENQLMLRIQRDDDGPRITHYLLLGRDIRTADVQEIPLGRIIQMINAGTPADTKLPSPAPEGVAEQLDAQAEMLQRQVDDLSDQIRKLQAEAHRLRIQGESSEAQDELEQRQIAGADTFDDDVTFQVAPTQKRGSRLMTYESLVSVAAMEPDPAPDGIPWFHSSNRQRLTRPGRGPDRDVDAFYQSVADAYREYVIRSSVVAPAIAKEADVPVGTARTWIKEARRRGFLEQPKSQTRKKQG
jgi:hypothetical protein